MFEYKLLLVGVGYMGREYAKVLKGQNIDFIAVGQSKHNCKKFKEQTGVDPISGGISGCLITSKLSFSGAIIAVNEESSAEVAVQVLNYGIKNVLIEKPAGMSKAELTSIRDAMVNNNAEVFVAYNRRFYASTQASKALIGRDGGVLSFSFDFTEWGHLFQGDQFSKRAKDSMFLANSTHVADLAFHLGGFPKELSTFCGGNTSWSSSPAVYSGAGVSNSGALFSYKANWNAPGRWGCEWNTCNHKIILQPLEELRVQEHKSVEIVKVDIDDSLDKTYKPGLYKQVECFLDSRHILRGNLLTIKEQLNNIKIYEKIAGNIFA